MQPSSWGKYLWTSIHFIALGFPDNPNDDDKNNYKNFFINLGYVIPCYKCSVNYKKHLKELPITNETLKNRHNLFKWTVDLHNIVNKELNKPLINLEDAYLLYSENFNLSDSITHNKEYIFLIMGFIIGVILTTILLFMPKNIRIK